MAANSPIRPAADIRYDLFEGSSPGITAPPTSPQSEEPGISLNSGESVRDLSSLIRRSIQTTSINPLHCEQAASLRNLTATKMPQESLPDLYRNSVKCMNYIIKEVLPKNKEQAQALFAKAEKVQTLLPQHRAKVIAALQ